MQRSLRIRSIRHLVMLFFCLLPIFNSTTVRAQQAANNTIDISFGNIPVKEALKKLEEQSSFHFAFMEHHLRQAQRVNAVFRNKTIYQVLDVILGENMLSWRQVGNSIIITPAQPVKPQKGWLSGTVRDKTTGEPFIGVIIRAGGQGVQTDTGGAFRMELPAGNYTVDISYIGYAPVQQQTTVRGGRETNLQVVMSEDKNSLSEVVVTDRKITGTNIALIQQIRDARGVMSGISREQIGRSQDRDASEVVRRIPGVSVIQNRFIVIRGLSQRYNSVMLNNALAPSFEADSRAFSFDIMPSNMIDRILIYKTAVPELPGDFAGGVVKVYTTGMPARNGFNIGYQASYRPNTTFRTFYEQPRGRYAWLGYDDGTYTMPKEAPERIDELTLPDRRALTPKFNNNWSAEQKTAPIDHRLNIDFGRTMPLSSKVRLGLNGGLSYTATSTYNIISRNPGLLVDGAYVKGYTFSDETYERNVRLNGLLNVALRIGNRHHIDFRNLYTHMGGSTFIHRLGEAGAGGSDGSGLVEGKYIRQEVLGNSFRGIYSGQLSGSHELFRDTKVSWLAGYTRSSYNDPDQRVRTWMGDADAYYADSSLQLYYPSTNISVVHWGRRYFELPESSKTFGFDLEQPLHFPALTVLLKAGVFAEIKDRSFRFRQLGYVNDSLIGQVIQEGYVIYNSYTAGNDLKAGYLAAELPFNRFRLYGGLRVEHNRQWLKGYNWRTVGPNALGAIDLERVQTSYLPSVNLSYNLSERSLVRAAYARTLNRPEFREIAPFYYLDLTDFRQAWGNEDLKNQVDIDNFDLRFEHYPAAGEMISAGVFYKHFQNPIELYYYSGTSGTNNFRWGNARSAVNYGAEVELMLGLGRHFNGGSFTSRQLRRVSVLLNAAYVFSEVVLDEHAGMTAVIQDSKRPLYGQSPFLVNAALNYTSDSLGLKLNVSYNIIGKRIAGIGNRDYPDIYELPRHSLDFTFSKTIGRFLELKGGVQNILNSRFIQMQDIDGNGRFDRNDNTDLHDHRYLSWYAGTYYTLGLGLRL